MKSISRAKRHPESGQTVIVFVVILAIVLFAFIGFAVDYSSLWFHRQMTQTAADAACQAGAMDMLYNANGFPVDLTNAGFNPGTVASYDCSATVAAGNKAPSPCQYAALNGFSGTGISGDVEGNQVTFELLSTLDSSTGVSIPPAALTSVPFMRVNVKERTKTYFSGLLTGRSTQDVGATAVCGLQNAKAPIPIVVLHPSKSGSFNIGGNPLINIYGGPSQSIQVNSENSTAVASPWGTAIVDLSHGGPSASGSMFGTTGGPNDCTSFPCSKLLLGSTGSYQPQTAPISDPFATVPAPNPASFTTNPASDTGVKYGTTVSLGNGGTDPNCPIPTGDTTDTCKRYFPGVYPNGISISGENAIFVPGVYILGDSACTGSGSNKCDLSLGSNSLVRPSAATGDGSGGMMFYFTKGGTLQVGSNSGGGRFTGTYTATAFPVDGVKCPGGADPDPPITDTLDHNVFLGPCSGTYGDPTGQYRGMLFFHDRATATDNVMNGGGGILIAGNMYFHQNTSYNTTLGLWGGSCSSTRILGNIVVDQLQMQGNSCINMQLNPLAVYNILKAQLLQ